LGNFSTVILSSFWELKKGPENIEFALVSTQVKILGVLDSTGLFTKKICVKKYKADV